MPIRLSPDWTPEDTRWLGEVSLTETSDTTKGGGGKKTLQLCDLLVRKRVVKEKIWEVTTVLGFLHGGEEQQEEGLAQTGRVGVDKTSISPHQSRADGVR